jgi:phage-related protein
MLPIGLESLYKNIYVQTMNGAKIIKGLEWIGSALKDLQASPLPVCRVFGYALYAGRNKED